MNEEKKMNVRGIRRKKKEKCWENGKPRDCGVKKEAPSLFTILSKKQWNFSFWYFILALVLMSILNSYLFNKPEEHVDFSEFKALIRDGKIKRVEMGPKYYIGLPFKRDKVQAVERRDDLQQQGSNKAPTYRTIPVNDANFVPMLDSMNVEYYAISQEGSKLFGFVFSWILPFLLMIFLWRFLFTRMGKMNSGVMEFSQNRAKLVAEGDTGNTFKDVAGVDEAKEELVEVVDFLKNPKKYTDIGGKIPKGVLLVGPPGTGKTLLARAVAGEAKVPFFRISGADFVEMFVGVGAARVRDLFKQAREKAPCIIFIDELDAIGKSRVPIHGGGNDEREQTLNQLLVEMDGFDSRTGVIILAATNRPEILDPALLRAGRFDRQVLVDKPDFKGREEILKIHVKNVILDKDVDLGIIARITVGFTGADLANIANESALLAVRAGRKKVSQKDIEEAIEKVIAGLQKKNRLINAKERTIVAYHETGHALIANFTQGADPVQKISIIPRGMGALGYTLQTPIEDRFLMTRQELLGKIDVMLGGRAAEQIMFGEISTGASNDIDKATEVAKRMVTEYGMSEKFGNVTLRTTRAPIYMGDAYPNGSREHSEATQQYIDEQIAQIIDGRYQIVRKTLTEKKELLDFIAKTLLEKEVLEANDFNAILKQYNH